MRNADEKQKRQKNDRMRNDDRRNRIRKTAENTDARSRGTTGQET